MNSESTTTQPATTPVSGADGHNDHHDHGHTCDHHSHHTDTSGPIDRTALVSARNLFVTLSGRPILTNIDIDIHTKEIVTLIGPNGSGKTTLVRTLLEIEKQTSGTLYRTHNLKIGYVPQRFDIDSALPITVDRFIRLGSKTSNGDIDAALSETGAPQTRERQLNQLSGGELQRVLLARALLADPSLLVLDEPVRGVDYVGAAEFYALLSQLRDTRKLGILLVSHDLHVVMAQSDRVICLNKHVCCSGVPEAVAQHPEYMRLFGAEAGRTFAIYQHHHDHRHDLSGNPTPSGGTQRA